MYGKKGKKGKKAKPMMKNKDGYRKAASPRNKGKKEEGKGDW